MNGARPAQLPRLAGRAPVALAWLACLLAAAWCLWMLAQLTWAILTPLDLDAAPAAASHGGASPALTASRVNVSQFHLFGNGHANAERVRAIEASQRTRLKLVLHGTVTGAAGYALIATADGSERSYRTGERIQTGVTLASVHADHVVLDHDGTHERLDLPRETLASAARLRPLAPAAATHLRPGVPGAPGTSRPPARPGGTPLYVAPPATSGRVDWERARTALQQRAPEAVAAELQLTPVFDGMELRGVRLGADNPLLAGSGLRRDDVVTAVNGVQLDSIARGEQLMHELQGAGTVQVTVLRDGTPQTLDIDLTRTP